VRSGSDAPADRKGVGRELRIGPDQYDGDAGLLSRELQSSARSQFDRFGSFQKNGVEGRTTRSFERGAQRVLLRAQLDNDDAIRRDAERGYSRPVNVTRL